jgi:purine-cytosine permease-like protein
MPDAELNAKIAELQLQPDGLIGAMNLIEEQSKLRQEDALELSKWKLQVQMHAATEPTLDDSFSFQDPASPITPPAAAQAVVQKTPESIPTLVETGISASVEPVTPEPTMTESLKHFPEVSSDPGSSPERIEDIVAALNASYAGVATDPEIKQTPSSQVDSTPLLASNTSSKIEAAPVSAPVALEVLEDDQVTPSQSENSVDPDNEDQAGPTRTAMALSWSWLAIAASPLALVVAAVIKDAGASLAQSVVLLASVLVITAFMAAVGSMASVRASSSLTVVSRAAFGVWGNSLPATFMLFAKLFWAAAFVYFSARIVSPLIFNQPWFADVAGQLIFPGEFTASLFVLIPMIVIAAIVSAFGGQGVLRLQQITTAVTVIGTGAFVYFVASTYSLQDLATVEAISTLGLIDLGLFAIALFGFAVLSFSGDFARKLPAETPGAKVFFLSFVSTFFLPLLTGVLGLLWLFMSEETISASFSAEVLATVAASAPVWVFVLFVVAVGLSILHLITASLYSLSGNLIGIAKIPGWVAALVVSVLVLAGVLVPSYFVAASTLRESVLELVLLAGVVAAAWAGIFVADALARTRGYHEVSLTREYGFYGKLNLVNALGFLLAVALGFGYLNGGAQLSSWTGYLGDLTPEIFELAGSNIGIAMAFGLAALLPVVLGIPRIRKQERNLAELDQRRQELKEFLDATA